MRLRARTCRAGKTSFQPCRISRKKRRLGGQVGTPLAADPFYVMRALALVPGIELPSDFYKGAPWTPAYPLEEAQYTPPWAPLVALLFPLAFALFWFANSLALRKAYLRRRPPQVPPLHMDIVAEIRNRIGDHKGRLRRLAQRLLVRSPETTDRIDVAATIAATLAKGAGHLVPAYVMVYRTPEYLVLIERRSAADQETERMRALIHRLRDLVSVTVYTYEGDPAMLDREQGGRPFPIEQALAAHSDCRLIVLGSGEGFLDPVSLCPRPAAQKLTHFRRRALLTPVPVAEWGREEFALAQELEMPIGRATAEGMERLVELLGLDGAANGEPTDASGDGLARALPEMLRVHPNRFFYSAPPAGVEVHQLLRELRNFLDGPGFEWLCALAVYPAVQWDLTLYLGVALGERRGGDLATRPLYREDRIAALTQLPWLREGAMPVWLRRSLIQELGRVGRADEVREALKALIGRAKDLGERRSEGDVVLQIAREQPIEGFDPEQLYDDEVLLDFMARGRVEDFALPRRSFFEAILPRGLLDRIGVPGLVAGSVALAYAVAAWWLTPKTNGLPWGFGSEGQIPAVTGAWLPLILLFLGGLTSLGLANSAGAAKLFRSALSRVPVLALSFGFLMLRAALSWSPLGKTFDPLWNSDASIYGITAALSLASLAGARGLLGLFFFLDEIPPSSLLLRGAGLLVGALLLSFCVLACINSIQDYFEKPYLAFLVTGLIALLICGAALTATRSISFERARRPVRPPGRIGAALKMATALALILPAMMAGRIVSSASVALFASAPGSSAVAETADGHFLAIGGADGRVQIYAAEQSAQAPSWTLPTEGEAIANLAITHQDGKAPAVSIFVAAAHTNGRVSVHRADGFRPPHLAWAENGDVRSAQAPFVAFGPDGQLMLAIERRDNQACLIAGPRGDQKLPLAGHGPVTALIALDAGRFAAATLDGAVHIVSAAGGGALSLQSTGIPLRFENSRARRLVYDDGQKLLTALADDGAVITAELPNGGAVHIVQSLADSRMALGGAVPFGAKALIPDKAASPLTEDFTPADLSSLHKRPFRFPRDTLDSDGRPRANLIFGLDISHYNGRNFRFDTLREQNVRFVYAKATQGVSYKDDLFGLYWRALSEVPAEKRVFRGAYHFLSSDADGAAQADTFLSFLENNGGLKENDMPPVVDLEWDVTQSDRNDRWQSHRPDDIIDTTLAWLKRVEEKTGRIPIVSTARSWWLERGIPEESFNKLSHYKLWIVDYSHYAPATETPPTINHSRLHLWAFSDTAELSQGYDGPLDATVYKGTEERFLADFQVSKK